MASDLPVASSDWPELDDRLVEPETPYEMLDGELICVSPADEPGELHVQIAALVEAHTGLEFEVACDLLTRTSKVDDIAPDVSVYPSARHPETGRRQLEQLTFEIVSTQSLGYVRRKAEKLASVACAGVRDRRRTRARSSGRASSRPGKCSTRADRSKIRCSMSRC
jgi:Uma2 family endonuclease